MAGVGGARGGAGLSQGAWKLALAAVAAIWGGSFVVIKDTLDALTPAWLMAIRFLCATLLVGLVFVRDVRAHLDRRHLVAGALLGVVSGLAYVVQNVGLADTTPGRNAFLTATYCVIVPFANWVVARRRPGARSLVAALLAIAGVGLVALGDDLAPAMSAGDWLTLVSAALFAAHIVLVARFAEDLDVMTITVAQLGVSAVVAFGAALALEPLPGAAALASPSVWLSLAYLVVLSSCVCMVVQNLGQAHVPPAQAGLILSLESVFAVLASVLFYGEVVTPRIAAGFATIFAAVLVSELGGRREPRAGRRGGGASGGVGAGAGPGAGPDAVTGCAETAR